MQKAQRRCATMGEGVCLTPGQPGRSGGSRARREEGGAGIGGEEGRRGRAVAERGPRASEGQDPRVRQAEGPVEVGAWVRVEHSYCGVRRCCVAVPSAGTSLGPCWDLAGALGT